jgi:hypothetical protein
MSLNQLLRNEDKPWCDIYVDSVNFVSPKTNQTPFDYFSEGTFDAVFGSAIDNRTVSIKYIRINNLVTLNIGRVAAANTANSFIDTSVGAIPSFLAPNDTDKDFFFRAYNNGVTQDLPGFIVIKTNGSISLFKTATATSFSGIGQVCGSATDIVVSYMLA